MTATATGPRLSPIDVVITRLAKRTGSEPVPGKGIGVWVADCPIGHAGHVESLDVRVAKDGRVALACVLGCSTRAIASVLDLRMGDLFAHARPGEPTPDAPGDEPEGLPAPVCALDPHTPEPITWCIEELLIAGELAVFAGDGGSFKSTAAFHMAAAVAGGYHAFGRFATERGPVLILSAEDGEGVVRNRLEALIVGHGWDRERVLSNVHILASHDAKLSNPEWQRHLFAHAQALGIVFMVCDPLFDLVDGDENSNTDLRPVIKFCRKIGGSTNAAVAIVHHATKVKEGQRSIDRVRGASALRDAARCVLFFEDRPEGVAIEHLKMSRSEKLPPFTITREIEASPESRAVWVSARFAYQAADEALLSRAETFVLDQVTAFPEALKSGDLRKRGNDVGISGENMAKALSRLQARGLLDYVPGANRAKFWVAIPPTTPPTQNCENPQFPDSGSASGRLPGSARSAGSPSGRPSEVPDTAASLNPVCPPLGGQADRMAPRPRMEPVDEPEVVDIPEEFDR